MTELTKVGFQDVNSVIYFQFSWKIYVIIIHVFQVLSIIN